MAKRKKKIETVKEEHGWKIVWKQDGKIMYWDAASDIIKSYYN